MARKCIYFICEIIDLSYYYIYILGCVHVLCEGWKQWKHTGQVTSPLQGNIHQLRSHSLLEAISSLQLT